MEKREHCLRCGRPKATMADIGTMEPGDDAVGEDGGLCWGAPVGDMPCEQRDWPAEVAALETTIIALKQGLQGSAVVVHEFIERLATSVEITGAFTLTEIAKRVEDLRRSVGHWKREAERLSSVATTVADAAREEGRREVAGRSDGHREAAEAMRDMAARFAVEPPAHHP